MPKAPVSPEVDAFLRRPNEGVVATLRADGSPFMAATWYDWDGSRVLLSMDGGRVRLRHMRRDPRVAFTAIDIDNWYWQVSLVGRATEIYDDTDFADVDRLAMRYIGTPYPDRSRPRVSAWMEVDSWNGWDPVLYGPWQAGVSQPPV